MRLLICTQTVDLNDPVLGFFHRWIEVLAAKYERVHVICLREGEHRLPPNVVVHSLGKLYSTEATKGIGTRFMYAVRFYRNAWTLRRDYDAVFVHMNQEYVLLGGKLWWILGKPVYLWRNHYAGGFLTGIASFFCKNIFCTSKYSYTAKYRKTILMPVGVDTNLFNHRDNMGRHNTILSLGRIAPSKRIEVLIEALGVLKKKGAQVDADIYGDPLPRDVAYRDGLVQRAKELGLEKVRFLAGVPNTATPDVYRSHGIFVNCSESGMYDKTIFEALACGTLVLATSRDFQEFAGERFGFSKASDLAEKIQTLTSISGTEQDWARKLLAGIVEKHSLAELATRLAEVMR